jgi:hypothetical protein
VSVLSNELGEVVARSCVCTDQLCPSCNELHAALAAMVADAERLDWLSRRDGAFDWLRFGDYGHYWHQYADSRNGRPGLREAIDTARQAAGEVG